MIRFKHILTAAACAVLFMLTASAQNPITIAVSSTPAAIVTTQPANYMKVRENSASPACGFTIILPGSTTALTYAAGTEFQFVAGPNAPWPSGTTIGTITSTGGSCTFVGVQSVGTVPSGQSAKPSTGGGLSGQTANCIPKSATATTATGCSALSDNGTTVSSSESVAVAGALSATAGITDGSTGVTGTLTLNGSTSGSASIAAPAVAGTSTNPITFSNVLALPAGTSGAPAIGLAGTTNGIYEASNNLHVNSPGTLILEVGGAAYFQIASSVMKDNGSKSSWNESTGNIDSFIESHTPFTITPVASPVIALSNGSLQTVTLGQNETPTITGISSGIRVTFQICQPASGGPFTWTWPATIHGGVTIGSSASTCSMQSFDSFTGTTLVPESAGVTGVAP